MLTTANMRNFRLRNQSVT